jgi:hypothetical protein
MFYCASNVLNWDVRIDPMLVEKIDAIGAKPLEHPFDGELDVFGFAVETGAAHAGFEIDVPSEL